MRIEGAKGKAAVLPIGPKVLASLRETARLFTTHYSTMIEGNRLEPREVKQVIELEGHFPGRARDEGEVKGYYKALELVEGFAASSEEVSEKGIRLLHGLVMGEGRDRVKPTPYRDGQNVIRENGSRAIVYMPPEAIDVPDLMEQLVAWIRDEKDLPCPVVAAIAHYQFATIHPYYDGNGRVARLLTTWVLYLGGYDFKGLYSLEEYYAKDLPAYYKAISIGPSHNYYLGRADADITPWIEYFCVGMAHSSLKVVEKMEEADLLEEPDHSPLLRKLDPKKRRALELFQEYEVVTSKQIGVLFGFRQGSRSALCRKWVEEGFLEVVNPSDKGRTYRLADLYLELLRTSDG